MEGLSAYGRRDLVYNWERFFCPREGNISLSDGGYLYDPESEWGKVYNPEVVHFEALADFPLRNYIRRTWNWQNTCHEGSKESHRRQIR